MANENKNTPEMEEEVDVVTLFDEEENKSYDFEVLAEATVGDKTYVALVPYEDEEADEYIVLEKKPDGDTFLFLTIDDDEEFERVEDYFNDLLFGEVDYDAD